MLLAIRNLRHDPIQVLLTVAGIGLSVMLVVVLLSVQQGIRRQSADYLEHVPGSVVVASEGTENFLMVPRPLSLGSMDAVREAGDVDSVVPLLSQMVVLQLHDRRGATFVVGYDPALGGGPRQVAVGRPAEQDGDIVLGRVLADRHSIDLGDSIGFLGQSFRVSGLADDPSPLMTSFVYVPRSTLERLLLAPNQASILVVTPRPGVAPEALRDELATIPDTSGSRTGSSAGRSSRAAVLFRVPGGAIRRAMANARTLDTNTGTITRQRFSEGWEYLMCLIYGVAQQDFRAVSRMGNIPRALR